MEEWREIPGYESLYIIANSGRVMSLPRKVKNGTGYRQKRGNLLKIETRNGYPSCTLRKEGAEKTEYIHRLLAFAFIANPENKPCINHKNSNRQDHKISNLEWCTHKENQTHAKMAGRFPNQKGVNHSQRIVDERQVLQIRKDRIDGMTIPEIAKKHNFKLGTIGSIVYRNSWKHI